MKLGIIGYVNPHKMDGPHPGLEKCDGEQHEETFIIPTPASVKRRQKTRKKASQKKKKA